MHRKKKPKDRLLVASADTRPRGMSFDCVGTVNKEKETRSMMRMVCHLCKIKKMVLECESFDFKLHRSFDNEE